MEGGAELLRVCGRVIVVETLVGPIVRAFDELLQLALVDGLELEVFGVVNVKNLGVRYDVLLLFFGLFNVRGWGCGRTPLSDGRFSCRP